MAQHNRQYLLNARPEGHIKDTDLKLVTRELPVAGEGQVLIKILYLAVEPAMRGWMENRASYTAPLEIGDVMRAFALGEIIESHSDKWQAGDRVSGLFGMQEYCVLEGGSAQLSPVSSDLDPATYLGVLGVTGLTAYCGMTQIGKPRAGDTVLVSGAAGATGSIAGQMARLAGCRVIGIAGTDDKCEWLTAQLGFDASINYKTQDVAQQVAQLCPDGIDVYWDNVGGETLYTAPLVALQAVPEAGIFGRMSDFIYLFFDELFGV